MIRDALNAAALAGAVALTIDAARDSRSVTAFDAVGPCVRATRILERHTYVLTACLARWSGERMTIADAGQRLGFYDCSHQPVTDTGRHRVALMAALDWPTETLTIEQLEAALRARRTQPALAQQGADDATL